MNRRLRVKKQESIRVKIQAGFSGRVFDIKNGVATTPLHSIINHKKQNVPPFVKTIIHFYSLTVKEHKKGIIKLKKVMYKS